MELKTEEQKQREEERLKEWVKKMLPETFDKIDVHAYYDSKLTYAENKELISKEVKQEMKSLKEQVEYVKAEQERFENERIKEAEAEALAYNQSMDYSENKEVEAYYKPVYRIIGKLCQGYSNLAMIKGRGGLGKSFHLKRALLRNKADFTAITGEVTEAYLYRLIYENNHKIIWLRDITKLLSSVASLNLLKAATESEEVRVLTKSNYSKDQADLPNQFVCKAKFVFDYNNVWGTPLQADFEALASRGDYVELSFCDDEVSSIMRLIASTEEEKEITEYVIKKYNESGLFRLNLRTQWKAFNTYKYAKANGLDWKTEIDDEFSRTDRIRALLYSLIGNKAVRTSELKKKLLKLEIVGTLRTADNKINEWLYTDNLNPWSEEERNFLVCINPRPKRTM